ncbi:DUF123 domain-containing protein [Methanococcus aeolicus]|uniref:thymine-DNA glycosylase n=1 Tax=Methanococcus aeolicus (strain ATCC BAA-1280 / DSM 17508 / OCM 812 / Nankai-3) TaxID=419665 RepID=A6UUP0_META3|nr:DUF123 domain-containing protein [Methanococcus aeolicus]ABR56212.1 DNA-(apurinic or apyrimidinic site) lyase [Methanococcus aeolicus Nankai-3]UXM84223.1 DUF123 domain-containing protein [Methanococcus aeolicus]
MKTTYLDILKEKLNKDSVVEEISKNSKNRKNKEILAFKVLISTVLSARTKDETTDEVSKRLYKKVKNIDDLINIDIEELQELIYPVGFYKTKAKHLKELALMVKNNYNGKIPNDINELVKLPGVGRKTANLVITLAFDDYGICVDTHVHRISNRWNFVNTPSPEKTEMELRKKLPKKYWKTINNSLVVYGREVCAPIPKCSKCIQEIKETCPYYDKLIYFNSLLNKYNFRKISKSNIPNEKGTYILKIKLNGSKVIEYGKTKKEKFQRGYYFYVGSAMGSSSNLKNRIGRHLKNENEKKLHWHIDYLLKYGNVKEIFITNNAVECEVSKDLKEKFEFIKGFGCSDCGCDSHLYYLKP